MSGRWMPIASALLLTVSAGIVVIALTRWNAAANQLDRARAELATVQQQAAEIRTLRAALEADRVATTGRRADALAEIADTLAAAGLPDTAMRSLDEQSDTEVGDAGLRRQTLRLALTSTTPGELGRFLARLQADRPHWVVTRTELTRPRRGDGNRYDAGLTLARTYDATPSTQGDSRP